LWLLPVLFAGLSCSGRHASPDDRLPGAVTHIVVCWLKTPGDSAARDKIIESSGALRDIPGVLSVSAGRMLPSTRPVVDSTYDVALVLVFRDEAALQAYDAHPIHQAMVRDVVRPLVSRFVVYDFAGD